MPRYFFHFSDGERTFSDSIGVELSGIAAARSNAIEQIREMRAAMSERKIQDWLGWKMIVADATGKVVFEVSFELTPRTR